MNQYRQVQYFFFRALLHGLRLTWPILSMLISAIVGLGLIVAHLEHSHPLEGIYFSFITGLTVGYGDFAPKTHLARIAAVAIGFLGVLLTGIVAAISVHALQKTAAVTQAPAESGEGC